jgi:hypothetical protein
MTIITARTANSQPSQSRHLVLGRTKTTQPNNVIQTLHSTNNPLLI